MGGYRDEAPCRQGVCSVTYNLSSSCVMKLTLSTKVSGTKRLLLQNFMINYNEIDKGIPLHVVEGMESREVWCPLPSWHGHWRWSNDDDGGFGSLFEMWK